MDEPAVQAVTPTDQVDEPTVQAVPPADQMDEPAVQAVTPTDQMGLTDSAQVAQNSEAESDAKKEEAEASPENQAAKPAPRKRYTRRKTSTKRAPYRGRRRRVEKPVSQTSETASPGGDQAIPEADGNVAEPRPASKEESVNTSPSVPVASPTAPSDLNPVKEPSPQSVTEDPPF